MRRKYLLACYEVPGYGGASTAAYQLLQEMRGSGLDVSFLNLIDEQDAEYFRYTFGENCGNPANLPDVHNCVLNGPLYLPHPELTERIAGIEPAVLIGQGFIAALLIKRAYPSAPLVFYTTGSLRMKDAIENNEVQDFLSQQKVMQKAISRPVVPSNEELQAIQLADLVIVHSETVASLNRYYYPFHACKMYSDVLWMAEWIYKEAAAFSNFSKPFDQRDIDVLFVASSWSRPEKNFCMVKQIVSRLKDARVHIVGETAELLPRVTHHELITRREDLFRLLGNAKTLVCPSLYDAAPGVLFEGSALGCNVMTSKNAGNWRLCNDDLLAEPFRAGEFVNKIRLSLSKRFADHIDYFFQADSYRKLVDVLSVI
jgi:glycosyltransferase involved in cell wall biosynthesis